MVTGCKIISIVELILLAENINLITIIGVQKELLIIYRINCEINKIALFHVLYFFGFTKIINELN